MLWLWLSLYETRLFAHGDRRLDRFMTICSYIAVYTACSIFHLNHAAMGIPGLNVLLISGWIRIRCSCEDLTRPQHARFLYLKGKKFPHRPTSVASKLISCFMSLRGLNSIKLAHVAITVCRQPPVITNPVLSPDISVPVVCYWNVDIRIIPSRFSTQAYQHLSQCHTSR